MPVRQIASDAGVDVALIGRYFGSKRGLFEATLVDAPTLLDAPLPDRKTLIDTVVALCQSWPRDDGWVSPVGVILSNAGDPEVGELVRARYEDDWFKPLRQVFGSEQKAANFTAALLGFCVAEKWLLLSGIPDHTTDEFTQQLRSLLMAATD